MTADLHSTGTTTDTGSTAAPLDRPAAPMDRHTPTAERAPEQSDTAAAPQTPHPARATDRPTGQGRPSLDSANLLGTPRDVPSTGWRRMLYDLTHGAWNPGLSRAERRHNDLRHRATARLDGCHRIVVVSIKGGIGKTTDAACLGLTLAHYRGDRVAAMDANPHAGNLAERLTNVTDVTIRELLEHAQSIDSYTDVSRYTSLADRLQVLASEQDAYASDALTEAEYRTVDATLARYFNIVITDCGTGLLHSAMMGALSTADTLVVVGAPAVDGASRAAKTLDWLEAHGHGELVARSVAVLNNSRPANRTLDVGVLHDHFAARCRAVVDIPYDPYLVTGGAINYDRLAEPTRDAFLTLAATVADGFSLPPLTRPGDNDPRETA